MEDGSNNTTMLSDTNNLDFSLMDDLLYDGFWLQTTTESNFWHPTESSPNFFPSLSSSSDHLTTTLTPKPIQEKSNIFSFPDNMDNQNHAQAQPSIPSVSLGQSTDFLFEETQLSKRLWVKPIRNPIRAVSVKKKLLQAVNHLRDSIRETDILVQIWVPVKRGGKQVLTTKNQPFSFNPNCKNLADYRDVSRGYQFAADEDSKESAGLPGRVFVNKLPEWTPDVRFFKREEYPRVNDAKQYEVRGSLALPVFERGSGKCLGVVEIVTTSLKVNYRPELENICKALEVSIYIYTCKLLFILCFFNSHILILSFWQAVDLKSSDILEQAPPDNDIEV